LLLYRLFSARLNEAEQKLLSSDPSLWGYVIENLEADLISDAKSRSEENVLREGFSYVERTTREGLQKQIERLTGQSLWLRVFPTGLLETFIEEHQKLITSVQREHLEKISLAIKRGLREGRLQKDMAKDIRNLTGMSKRRSQLIARNAPLQYSGALTKHHQMSAGIKKYRWQTSHDERVRDSHIKRDGNIYPWDSPGPHPRSEVNCRCDAVPLLD
jgi:SPP1 gp7 family putative phage head morphogenesis protein